MKYYCEKCESEDIEFIRETLIPNVPKAKPISEYTPHDGSYITAMQQIAYKNRATCKKCGNFKEVISHQ